MFGQAIIENLDIKKAFYSELGTICKPSTIFASNTSSFEIGFMSNASGRPDKMVGMHFFNPGGVAPADCSRGRPGPCEPLPTPPPPARARNGLK